MAIASFLSLYTLLPSCCSSHSHIFLIFFIYTCKRMLYLVEINQWFLQRIHSQSSANLQLRSQFVDRIRIKTKTSLIRIDKINMIGHSYKPCYKPKTKGLMRYNWIYKISSINTWFRLRNTKLMKSNNQIYSTKSNQGCLSSKKTFQYQIWTWAIQKVIILA